ncbi:MAG: hypothetical protein CL917_09650 [Deltaproteobacteria bacterium]|nr:hypothetical protein [Deltaproteobacteria bacterium]
MRSLSVLLMIIFSLGLGCSDSNDSGSNGSGGNDGFGDTEGPGPDPLIPVDSGCPMQGNPCCEVPATADSLNLCFQSLTTGTIEAGLPPSRLGVLVHGWDGTEKADTPWAPGNQQSGGERWSSSYINVYNISTSTIASPGYAPFDTPLVYAPATISIYSIFSGGLVLSIPDTQVWCGFAQDAGTDGRTDSLPSWLPEQTFPKGCGPRTSMTAESDLGGWCAECSFGTPSSASTTCANSKIKWPSSYTGAPGTGQCTIPAVQLSAMLQAQNFYSDDKAGGIPNLDMAYNEVVVEPLIEGSTDTISAFYTPLGTDPRARACASQTERPGLEGTNSVCCPMDAYTRKPTGGTCVPNESPDQMKTCEQMQYLYEELALVGSSAEVPLLEFDPINQINPFKLLCSSWAECSAEGGPCEAPSE